MKIAIIAGRDPGFKNDTDGGSVFLKNFTLELIKRNYYVDIFTPMDVSGSVYNINKTTSIDQNLFDSYSTNLNIYRFPILYNILSHKNDKLENYFLCRIDLSLKIGGYFSKKKLFSYDLIFILHMANAFGILEQNASPLNKTILFPMMTTPTYKLFSEVPQNYIDMEKKVFEKIKHISSPSNDEIITIINFYGVPKDKFFKINRGYNNDIFTNLEHTSIKNKKTVYLFSANGIRPQKNHLFFIPLVKRLIKYSVNIHVRLTGNNGHSHNNIYNEYTNKFWEEIKINGLEKYFTAYGIVSEKELNKIMRTSDIAVYPSVAETFGKSALESMATGLPTIVGSNIKAYDEFIIDEETGISANLRPEIFAQKIIKLINDDEYYHKLSINGIHRGLLFTWEKITNDFFVELTKRNIL